MSISIKSIDEAVLFFIQGHMKSPALDGIMVFITSLGNAGLFWIVLAVTFIVQKRYQKWGISLICTISLSRFLGDDLLKPLFSRLRPCNRFPDIELLIQKPSSPSFPSGHTMVAFAAAMMLYYFNKRLGVACFVLAFLIAFSRLYLFVHYPTDILGGILFGVLSSKLLYDGLTCIYKNIENGVTLPPNS